MLLTKEVEIIPCGKDRKRYEELGYDIPLHWDENNRKWAMPRGTKITVKVEDLSLKSSQKVQCQCDNCGAITTNTYKDYLDHNYNGLTYCNKCSSKIFISGENSYMWNPDLTDEEREVGRLYPLYIDFIKKVLKRDGYRCKICGSNDNCEVHHLDGYNWCKDKRTDISNGITLCFNCHKSFHNIYGHGNNTKEQFEEWCNTKILLEENDIEIESTRAVICLDDFEIIPSIRQYMRDNGDRYLGIYKSCNNVAKVCCCKKYYMWYDEYLKLDESQLSEIIEECRKNLLNKNQHTSVKIVDVMTKQLFRSKKEAADYVGKYITFVQYKIDRDQEWNGHKWVELKNYDGDINELEKVGDGW